MRVRRVRTLGAVLAIAVGVGAVVWVTCCYESVRRAVQVWANEYIGRAQITIDSPFGKYDTLKGQVATEVAQLPQVAHVTAQLVQRLRAEVMTRAKFDADTEVARKWKENLEEIDLHGISLAEEPYVRDHRVVQGRMLNEEDTYACVFEASYATEKGVGVGDVILVWAPAKTDGPYEIKIVGLVERRSISKLQKAVAIVRLPVLQEMSKKDDPPQVTSIDVVLKDKNQINEATRAIAGVVRPLARTATIASAESRMRQIEKAQEQQKLVLVLLSCVAMLTALFIILSTLSMGMIERIAQLGLMRCIGLTGGQLAALVLCEVVPLGGIGIVAGIPIGLALAALTVWIVPEYVGQFTISIDGILLACAAGMVTTLVAAMLPAFAAARVSPMEAARPRARQSRRLPLVVAGVLSLAFLALQLWVMNGYVQRTPDFVNWATLSVVLLYSFYALAAPVTVALFSAAAVYVIGLLVGVRARLLQDQVGHAVWRSAGICCGLMVGLSLIVGLMVFNRSFQAGWEFPKQFPEAYFWSYKANLKPENLEKLKTVPGLSEYTICQAINVWVMEKPLFNDKIAQSVTWFLGCDAEADAANPKQKSFFDLVKLEFMEGDEKTARELLKRGGYVLIASDFARSRNRKVGDEVPVYFGNVVKQFKVAAIIDSPALDIAAGYFQAQSEARVVAVGSVLGARADMKKMLDLDGGRLVLMNFKLPPTLPPPGWPPARGSTTEKLPDVAYDTKVPVERRWQRYEERQVLREVEKRIEEPQGFFGTAEELKDEIDHRITEMTQLLAAVPAVALIVAAIGVANLMTANVTSRAKQLAMMRAIGATRGLILRMVVGEALVLGVLGSILGLALGFHLAWNTTTMTQRMWGYNTPFQVPWSYVAGSVVLTVGLCVLAGVLPARHASRTNVIDALHVP